MPSAVVISLEAVRPSMAGTAIRAYELARALQPHADVTLAAVRSDDEPPPDVRHMGFRPQDPAALQPLIASADLVVCQPQWPIVSRMLAQTRARVVIDLYCPEYLESLENYRESRRGVRALMGALNLDRLDDALRVGHHFICATDLQRDLWLGVMLTRGRIDAAVARDDPSLRRLIDLVPFGVDSASPDVGGPGPYALDGVDPGDDVILWNGGLWSWLDAETPIRAIAKVRERHPRARLVFMGRAAAVSARRATAAARALAAQLGLLGSGVIFNEEWVPYAERGAWLRAARCAVSTHHDHLETRFAFRTRLLDCLWAGLPIVCTRGDELATAVEDRRLGATVDPGDVDAVAAGIAQVLDRGRDAYAPALAQAAADFAWSRVSQPLVGFLEAPVAPPRPVVRRRPAAATRGLGYVAARSTLNGIGLRSWPGG